MRLNKKLQKTSLIGKMHAWLGFVSSFFILSLVITGLLLSFPNSLKKTIQSTDPFSLNPHFSYVTNEGIIFIATDSKLFISEDQSQSFLDLKTPFSAKYLISMTESSDNLYAALKNGLIYKLSKQNFIWVMLESPETLDIFSISFHKSQLWMSAYEGLFNYDGTSWRLIKKNTSPINFQSTIKALHAGYPPFEWLRNFNIISSILLIIVLSTGVFLFIKFYFRALTKKDQ